MMVRRYKDSFLINTFYQFIKTGETYEKKQSDDRRFDCFFFLF
jgi:hypothetical protein